MQCFPTCLVGSDVSTVAKVIHSKPSFTKITLEGFEDLEPSITKIIQGMYVFREIQSSPLRKCIILIFDNGVVYRALIQCCHLLSQPGRSD